jgi:hypothetical protein
MFVKDGNMYCKFWDFHGGGVLSQGLLGCDTV